jgi:hypothetical protein
MIRDSSYMGLNAKSVFLSKRIFLTLDKHHSNLCGLLLELLFISFQKPNPEIKKLVPSYFDNTEKPISTYSHKRSSRGMILNYKPVTAIALSHVFALIRLNQNLCGLLLELLFISFQKFYNIL